MATTPSRLAAWAREGSTIIGLAGGAGTLTAVASGALTWQQGLGGFVFSAIAILIRQHVAPDTIVQGDAVVAGNRPVVNTGSTIINTSPGPRA